MARSTGGRVTSGHPWVGRTTRAAAVVVVAAEEYDRLRQLERLKAPSFVDHLLAIPKDDGEFERLTAQPRDPGV